MQNCTQSIARNQQPRISGEMIEKICKSCGTPYIQFRTTQNLCEDCYYKKVRESASKQVRKRIAYRGRVTKQWLEEDRPKWIKNHPPTHEGYWECYLQIAPNCRRWLTKYTLTLDHVKPRGTNPSKRRKQQNFKPACRPCNQLKGSMTLARVKKLYPDSLIARGRIEP